MCLGLIVTVWMALEVSEVAGPAFSIVTDITGWSPMVAYQWGWTLDSEDVRLTSPPPDN